ncbi:arylsulfatase [Lentisphaerota bacterium WC36G]|nr:arylsulfatase [Lentisphaerae bacterium WC36]
MKKFITTTLIGVCFTNQLIFSANAKNHRKYNVIVIYADDLGYGDVSCYGSKAIKTPNIDCLAETGVKFTDAHSSAATCTPSRVALLTGQYAFRTKAHILTGDAKLVIDPNTETVADVFKSANYNTAVIGKWHLGLGRGKKKINWNKEISYGPRELGFDYSFLVPATGDRVPCVYLENQKVINLDPNDPIEVNYKKKIGSEPTFRENPNSKVKQKPSDTYHDKTIVNGVSRIGYMSGGKSALWKDEDMADTLTRVAKEYINKNQKQPFFLYFSLHDPHVPRMPHPRFVGKTKLGPRGDAIVQADWCVGEIINELEKLNLREKTLIIFSSDNGPVLDNGYEDQSLELNNNHKIAGGFSGRKSSNLEGGTRVPFIVSLPTVTKKSESNALVSQVDFIASMANFLRIKLNDESALDSMNQISTWLGQEHKGRKFLITEARDLSLRDGSWKYISYKKNSYPKLIDGYRLGTLNTAQLYNLTTDMKETNNLAATLPQKITQMKAMLKLIKQKPNAQKVIYQNH